MEPVNNISKTMQDSQKMMQQMMESWVDTQQQMIDQWLETVESYGEQSGSTFWNQTLSVWESSVKRTMEAQNATLNSWMSQMQDMDGMPEEAAEQVEEGKAIVKKWTETQSELWDKWFEMMHQMDPSAYESGMTDMMKQAVSSWRGYTDQMQKMSEEMASMATDDTE
jgi:DNA-binding transcriptional regulator YbjK